MSACEGLRIWHGQVGDTLVQADVDLLSSAERERALRLLSTRARARYAAIHADVRRTLGAHLDVPPDRVSIGRLPCPRCGSDRHGPPHVDSPRPLFVSLSRSAGHWLLAANADGPIGVDLEVERDVHIDQIAAHTMSPAEQSFLRAQDTGLRLSSFFTCWTRKEAVAKAAGVGLAADLPSIDVSPEVPGAVKVLYGEANGPGQWIVEDLLLGPGLHAAVAQAHGHIAATLERRGEAS
jgi:4'-phosphopantetheinyl transferase